MLGASEFSIWTHTAVVSVIARHVLHIQRGHIVKPPGPKADKRRLWDNSESGLCWSMNCELCDEPKIL